MEYLPSIQDSLLELTVTRCLEMDVEIKISDAGQAALEAADDADDAIFELEDNHDRPKVKLSADVTVDEMANKLDALMMLLCDHLSQTHLPIAFRSLLRVFETCILTTHKAKFVQFALFYACGRESQEAIRDTEEEDEDSLHRDFLAKIIDVLVDPYKSVLTRQTGVCYVASFVSRANYCGGETVCEAVSALLRWAEAYMDSLPTTPSGAQDAREQCSLHVLFYTVAQAAFYTMCFRGQEALAWFEASSPTEEDLPLVDIRPCRWERLCGHPLNPLKFCLESVRIEFLELAAVYQLIPDQVREVVLAEKTMTPHRKKRRSIAIATPATLEKERLKGGVGGLGEGANPLDSFFPFDPYLLRQSHSYIEPFYRHWEGSALQRDERKLSVAEEEESVEDDQDLSDESLPDSEIEKEEDEDDDDEDEDDDASSLYNVSRKDDAMEESPPVFRVELEGDWTKNLKRPRAPSMENGSW